MFTAEPARGREGGGSVAAGVFQGTQAAVCGRRQEHLCTTGGWMGQPAGGAATPIKVGKGHLGPSQAPERGQGFPDGWLPTSPLPYKLKVLGQNFDWQRQPPASFQLQEQTGQGPEKEPK